uniref:Uncharacterized protein n=1 Tax=Meloidogyne incognita TaxID=6306 RepID=A0A914MVZ8_MELIC
MFWLILQVLETKFIPNSPTAANFGLLLFSYFTSVQICISDLSNCPSLPPAQLVLAGSEWQAEGAGLSEGQKRSGERWWVVDLILLIILEDMNVDDSFLPPPIISTLLELLFKEDRKKAANERRFLLKLFSLF